MNCFSVDKLFAMTSAASYKVASNSSCLPVPLRPRSRLNTEVSAAANVFRLPTARRHAVIVRASRRPESYENNRNQFSVASNEWLIPKTLVKEYMSPEVPSAVPLTVYSVRVQTSYERGSALSEPNSYVNLCLVGQDGNGLLHRISPVNDPAETEQHLSDICKVADEGLGANCAIATATTKAWKGGQVKLRFQEGSVDEVSILAPDLGSISALLLATEGGTWTVDEVIVSSSRTSHIDRFVCRRKLGGKSTSPAAYLTPVPPDAVIYGSGESALVLTKEQAAVMRNAGMSEYETLKSAILTRTAVLTLLGTGVFALTSGLDAAIPFATGGVVGVLYQWLLQQYVDSLVRVSRPPTKADSDRVSQATRGSPAAKVNPPALPTQRGSVLPAYPAAPSGSNSNSDSPLFGNGALRFSLLFAAIGAGFLLVQDTPGSDVDQLHLSTASLWQLLVGVLGFFSYKLAMISVSMAPQETRLQTAKQYERNSP